MNKPTIIHDDQDSFFYNLRFMLIVCVLAGNALEPIITRFAGAEAMFLWIYTFHMPLFVWVTGYFARHSLKGTSGRNVLKQIALQYLLFQSLYAVMDYTVFHTPHMRLSIFAPYLLLWFLASHFCWRLLLRLTLSWKPIYRLLGAVMLGVCAGYLPIDGFWLSFSRTFVFLPFFVIGYDYGASIRSHLRSGWGRRIAATLSVALLGWIGLGGFNISPGWLLGSMTYAELGHHEWFAGIYRLGIYALEIGSGALFLAWVPSLTSRLTDLGRRTLYVFLLHGFLVRLAVWSGVYNYMETSLYIPVIVSIALLFAITLAHPAVRHALRPLIEPDIARFHFNRQGVLKRSASWFR
ncbi:fucose 4-O-acetylase [Paenibacillus taichungensis]|uniref:acyltransferase family protein n=1 Tax=Paenibacillus taichungensis TaxID=484184 RepID=UPI002DBA2118|nr:fucose 4-O-acetylase [Paenibacillus taichungensis]MEC0108822.1 fucose 4-O-acetylase [Paenibacillus taichungensis]MEC0196322.1 fucose 4-O-acetylase [Paenibacillus taichungensis]